MTSAAPGALAPFVESPLRFYLAEDTNRADSLALPPEVLAPLKFGTHLHSKGYVRISAGPYRGQYLHILIWKWTHPGEFYDPALHDIHHRNGNPLDFSPENLERVPHREHSTITQKVGRLVRKGGKFASPAKGDFAGGGDGGEDGGGEECPF